MKTIHKYVINPEQISELFWIDMHGDAKVLTCQMQGEDMCIWAEVETDKTMHQRPFGIFGTGKPIEARSTLMKNFYTLTYIATVQYNHGLVWHIYEYV